MEFNSYKPLRLIELFAGIGSQAKALKNLGIEFEHWYVCEWDKYAIQSYNAVHGTNFNTSDITKLTAKDLNINDTEHYNYLITYSFPCQDLSNAGKGRGMEKGSGTRSGLLWEVERLLNECTELPQPIPLELTLGDLLEKEVDEKYYLSERAIEGRKNTQFNQYKLESRIIDEKGVHPTILARYEGAPTLVDETKSELKSKLCNELLDKGLVEEGDVIRHSYTNNRLSNGDTNMSRTESKEKLSPTLDTRCDCLGVVVKEPSELQKEVCNKAMESGLMTPYDIIDYTYSNARLGEILDGKLKTKNSTDNQIANTLTCNVENMGVCVPGEINVVGNYSPSGHEASRIVHPEGVAPTIKENHGTVTATVEPNLRIRKLTPKECWRLMGFDDEDVEKAAKVCSNSQLYKQAGNSIVVNVLMAIFKELFVPKKTRSEWLDELLGGV